MYIQGLYVAAGEVVDDDGALRAVGDEEVALEVEGVDVSRVAVELEELVAALEVPAADGAVDGRGDELRVVGLERDDGAAVALERVEAPVAGDLERARQVSRVDCVVAPCAVALPALAAVAL